MGILILFLIMILSISFFCSLLESTLLSLPKAYITVLQGKHSTASRLLLDYKEKIDRPLAAILSLNTIANTLGAAGVGVAIHDVWGNQWVAIGSTILTFLILVFAEIIPKTLGANYFRQMAPFTGHSIRILIWIMYPLVRVLEIISNVISKSQRSVHISREELIASVEIGESTGEIVEREKRIFDNLMKLNTIITNDIMTPRPVIFALQKDETIGKIVEKYKPMRFSRIPVFDNNLDEIVGMIFRYEILGGFSKNAEKTINEIIHPIEKVPGSMTVSSILDRMIKNQEQILIVMDEYGGTDGIVTLEDVVETLLGVEIVDELDNIVDLRKHALENAKQRQQERLLTK